MKMVLNTHIPINGIKQFLFELCSKTGLKIYLVMLDVNTSFSSPLWNDKILKHEYSYLKGN